MVADKENQVEERGWPTKWFAPYAVSKIGVNFSTAIQQKMPDDQYPNKDVIVNACCPGLVDTDMTKHRSSKKLHVDEGADTPTYLALLPKNTSEPRGQFCELRKSSPWPPIRYTNNILGPVTKEYLNHLERFVNVH